MAQDRPAIPIVAAIPAAIRVAALDLFLFLVAKDRLVFWSDDVLPGRLLDFCYRHRLRIVNINCDLQNEILSVKIEVPFARTRWGIEFFSFQKVLIILENLERAFIGA